MATTEAINIELITIDNFNKKKLIMKEPKESKIPESTMTYWSGALLYQNSLGQEQPIVIGFPEQWCPGVYSATDVKGNPKDNEWQICYYVKPIKRENMNEKQQKEYDEKCKQGDKVLQILKDIRDFISDEIKKYPDYFSEEQATLIEAGKYAKQIFSYPFKKDKEGKTISPKRPDTTKPERFYVQVKGNKKTQRPVAKFYGPNDVELELSQVKEIAGLIEPVIKFSHIYFGAKASVQIHLYDCNYSPIEMGHTSNVRLSRPNKNQASSQYSPPDEEAPSSTYDPNKALNEEDTPPSSPVAKPKKIVRKKKGE